GDAGLVHQALHGLPERLRAVPALLRHLGLLAEVGDIDTSLLARRTHAHVDGIVLHALLAGRDPDRDADEVGVRELLPRPCVRPAVEEYVLPRGRDVTRSATA